MHMALTSAPDKLSFELTKSSKSTSSDKVMLWGGKYHVRGHACSQVRGHAFRLMYRHVLLASSFLFLLTPVVRVVRKALSPSGMNLEDVSLGGHIRQGELDLS